YTGYLATRYLFGKHRVPFIAFISRTTIIGMALGVATLVLALGVMRGFESVVTEKIIGFDTHIRIEKLFESGFDLDEEKISEITAISGVKQIFRIKKAEVMLKANDITEGALLEVMPEEALSQLYSVSANYTQGQSKQTGLIVGAALAEQLGVGISDQLLVYDLGSFTDQKGLPSIAATQVQAIYESGMIDYDKSYLYCSPQTMEEIFPESPDTDDFGVFLTDISLTDGVMEQIDQILPYSHLSISWRDRHQTLFNWMKTQQLPIFVIFSLIMIVAVVNIASTLILIIMEKRTEIGTLRALGTSRKRIRCIFGLEGLMMGLLGTAFGIILSVILSWVQTTFGIISLPSDVYFMDKVSILIGVEDVIAISGGVILLAILSSLIPAMQASSLQPADTLRDE
ncbi:MAG: FtsX-like permease family protein, partial [Candidatus Marinimicrobia bacterium]|nr:FtsX-like permease family protein [Candidatus Neomarinimicrobiota bacterium]